MSDKRSYEDKAVSTRAHPLAEMLSDLEAVTGRLERACQQQDRSELQRLLERGEDASLQLRSRQRVLGSRPGGLTSDEDVKVSETYTSWLQARGQAIAALGRLGVPGFSVLG